MKVKIEIEGEVDIESWKDPKRTTVYLLTHEGNSGIHIAKDTIKNIEILSPNCGCFTCDNEWRKAQDDWSIRVGSSIMVLCSECGNKRCPHATNHIYACTGSNEPGQEGSRYTFLPKD